MTTPDLAPTRLDRARQKIADLLKLRDGMPAGLVAYSGSAHLVLPPTPDRDVVIGMSDGLTVPFALAAGLSGAIDATRVYPICCIVSAASAERFPLAQ